jgi:hypothetical protein
MRGIACFAVVAAVMAVSLASRSALPEKANTHKDSPQQLQAEIVTKERQELEALKNGRVQEFTDLMAEEAIFVDSHGSAGKAEIIAHLSDEAA